MGGRDSVCLVKIRQRRFSRKLNASRATFFFLYLSLCHGAVLGLTLQTSSLSALSTTVWSPCYRNSLSFWKLKQKKGIREMLHAGRHAVLLSFDCSSFAGQCHSSLMLPCNFQPPAVALYFCCLRWLWWYVSGFILPEKLGYEEANASHIWRCFWKVLGWHCLGSLRRTRSGVPCR